MTKIVTIIGSGPAGCTAAIYLGRSGYQVKQILGQQPGGQIILTNEVENYPGFSTISGAELADKMQKHAALYTTDQIQALVKNCKVENNSFSVELDNGTNITSDAIIIATGATAKWLNIESEANFKNFGVSSCATCDGFFYKNKDVVVVGGGNTAVEEAIFLANFAKSVHLIHRKDTLRAEKIMQDKLFSNTKISCIWNSEVIEIIGTDNPKHVTGLKIKNIINEQYSNLSVDGVFIAIGHKPQTDMFRGLLELDDDGYIKILNQSTETSVPGIFAAGDVQDKKYKQAITAAAQGCIAALECSKFLEIK